MKQHITKSQLNELSIDIKGKLIVYLQNKNIKWGLLDNDVMTKPLLNIGQMIEFLQTYKKDKRYKNGYPDYISFCQPKQNDYYLDEWWYILPDTLCDDLWSAVKELLTHKPI